MSVGVELLVRDYAEHLDSLSTPVDVDSLLDAQTKPVVRGPRRQLSLARGVVVGLAAFGVVLAVGAIGIFGPFNPSSDLAAAGSEWSRVPYSEDVFGKGFEQAMLGVTVGGPGLVAVGGEDEGAAVWTSRDGITWSRIPDDEDLFEAASMYDVTAGGPGLVAVGQSEPNAAVWTSVDGLTWSRVPHDEAVFGGEVGSVAGGANMSSVTVGGPGLVAVGFDGDPQGGGDAAVWTSVDGVTWSRVPHDEAIFGGEDDGYYGQSMSSVTAGGPGLVAVGSDVGRAAVWTSPDGVTWSRVPHDEAVFGGATMNGVAVGGPGLVAVGQAQNTAAVWTSPDGIAWSRVPHDEVVFGGGTDTDNDVEISSVTVGAEGLVAVGSDPDREGGAVWTSIDGLTWFRIPHDEAVFGATPDRPHMHMSSVTAGGPGFVAVGAHGVRPTAGPTDNDAVVWVAEQRE